MGAEYVEGESIGAVVESGQSLDVFFVNDTSRSLIYTDPFCMRYDAIVKFKNDLKMVLGDTGDVRATFITFSKSAKDIKTFVDFVNLKNDELDSVIKNAVCKSEGSTIPSAGFRTAITKYQKLKLTEEKDTSAVIFFTDGGGGDHFASNAFSMRMRDLFEHKIYSLLLVPEGHDVKDTFDTRSFLKLPRFIRLLSKYQNNIIPINQADKLSEAISSVLRE